MPGDPIVKRLAHRLAILAGKEDAWILRSGSFRDKELFGVLRRPAYCYGMLRAADQAKYLGRQEVTAVEFGVANGEGLLNMIELSKAIEQETGVKFHLIGFDAGGGLPQVRGYKDHAELWRSGDFPMQDRDGLMRRIDGQAEVIFGDINDTIEQLKARLSPNNPLGFVAIDVTLYTATLASLRCLEWAPELYPLGVSIYLDDTQFFFANEWAGELLAIKDFNARSEYRKIGEDRSLPGRRPRQYADWYRAMYVCHVLDHQIRNEGAERHSFTMDRHHEFMTTNALY